jgi:desulfoferrodoxin (superoxide reductase-like protein)
MAVAACCLFIAFDVCAAHPPSTVTLTYDAETAVLNVEIAHSVKKVTQHFVDRVVVELNHVEIIEQKFNIQGNEKTQEATYIIPGVHAGDTLTVTAYCNISGKKIGTLEVTEPVQGEE